MYTVTNTVRILYVYCTYTVASPKNTRRDSYTRSLVPTHGGRAGRPPPPPIRLLERLRAPGQIADGLLHAGHRYGLGRAAKSGYEVVARLAVGFIPSSLFCAQRPLHFDPHVIIHDVQMWAAARDGELLNVDFLLCGGGFTRLISTRIFVLQNTPQAFASVGALQGLKLGTLVHAGSSIGSEAPGVTCQSRTRPFPIPPAMRT